MSARKKRYPRDLPWGLILNLTGIFFICIGVWLFTMYSHRYICHRFFSGFSFVMILLPCFGFQHKYLQIKGGRNWQKFVNGLVIIVMILSIVTGLFFLKTYYDESQLEKHGTITHGTVIGYETTGKGSSHYATFEFVLNNERYIQKVSNSNEYYKIGDRLILIVSENDPEIFNVIGVENKSSKN